MAGHDRLVVVVGPAGTGKTTALAAAVADLRAQRRPVFGVAPTAKAAQVLGRETGMDADTVAKLLHEWSRPGRPPLPDYRLAPGATLIVDEAGLVGTASLARLVELAETQRWRLVLVGDPAQLQAVGRGGLFAELCATVPVHELARIHRFTQPWEAAASTRLRAGDPAALDDYQAHGRIHAGTLDDHVAAIAAAWPALAAAGTVAVTAATNDHVDLLNEAIQQARLAAGHLDPARAAAVAGGERVHPGDWVATRRNDRALTTTAGHAVHNRDLWTVEQVHDDGALTVTHRHGHGTVTLPADYAARHVRLGYAATGHGHQGDTVDVALTLVDRRDNAPGPVRGRHPRPPRQPPPRRHRHRRPGRRPATPWKRSWPGTGPTSPPSPNAATSPTRRRPPPSRHERRHRPGCPTPWPPCASGETNSATATTATSTDAGQAAAELAGLQPALAAARAAWRPYAERIDAVDRDLRAQAAAGHVGRQPGRHARPLRAAPRHPPPSRPRHRSRRRRPHPHRRHPRVKAPPSRNDSTRSPPEPRTSANGPPAVTPSPSSTATTARTSNTPNASSKRSPPGNDGPTDERSRPTTWPPRSRRSPTPPTTHRTPATTAPDSPGRTTRNSSSVSTACGASSAWRTTSNTAPPTSDVTDPNSGCRRTHELATTGSANLRRCASPSQRRVRRPRASGPNRTSGGMPDRTDMGARSVTPGCRQRATRTSIRRARGRRDCNDNGVTRWPGRLG